MTAGIVIAIIVVALLFYVASKPNQFRIERSLLIDATSDKLYAQLIDFHRWDAWSPWAKLDANMKTTFSGAAQGVGAVYEWLGNNKVGQGRMEIIEAQPLASLKIKLDFLKPFAAHNVAEFSLTSQTSGTLVSWTMYGPSPFISKLMSLFFNMDKMVGRDFERGLDNLRRVVQS